jgi:hypothetical protein
MFIEEGKNAIFTETFYVSFLRLNNLIINMQQMRENEMSDCLINGTLHSKKCFNFLTENLFATKTVFKSSPISKKSQKKHTFHFLLV